MTDLTPEPVSLSTHGVNVPLLRKVLEHITEHPEEWDQSTWGRVTACGTAHCVAGWAVTMAGLDVDTSRRYFGSHLEFLTDGREIGHTAAELVGIEPLPDDCDEGHLFSPHNSLRTIWTMAHELTHGEIEIPEQLR